MTSEKCASASPNFLLKAIEGDATQMFPDRGLGAFSDRGHDGLDVATDETMARGLALVERKNGARIHGVVNLQKRDAARIAGQLRPAIFPSLRFDEARRAQSEKKTANHDGIGIDAAGQGSGVNHLAGHGEDGQDVNGKTKLLVDHFENCNCVYYT